MRLTVGAAARRLVVLALAGAVFASACGGDDMPRAVSPTATLQTPTAAALAGAPSIDQGRKAAIARDPVLAGFIDAVESADIDQVLKFFSWNAIVCNELIYRGVSECERRGVKDGTVLEFFAPEWWEGAGLTRDETRQAMSYDLEARHPRLSLVVERSDGPTVLLFMIDPKPGLVLPGGSTESGSSVNAIWFATAKDAKGQIATFDHRYEGSPPMEFLRYAQHIGRFDFTILGVTPEFEEIEKAFHAGNEKQRTIPPVP